MIGVNGPEIGELPLIKPPPPPKPPPGPPPKGPPLLHQRSGAASASAAARDAADSPGAKPSSLAPIKGRQGVGAPLRSFSTAAATSSARSDLGATESRAVTPAALVAAAYHGSVEEVTALLKAMREQGNERSLDLLASPSGRTALHAAAATGHVGVVRALLDAGADVNALTAAGETALLLAALAGHDGVVSVLMDHGLRSDSPRPLDLAASPGLHALGLDSPPPQQATSGLSQSGVDRRRPKPLMLVGNEDDAGSGARPSIFGSSRVHGITPLMAAAAGGSLDAASSIIASLQACTNGAPVDASKLSASAAALMSGVPVRNTASPLLLTRTALNASSLTGMTPLMYACAAAAADGSIGDDIDEWDVDPEDIARDAKASPARAARRSRGSDASGASSESDATRRGSGAARAAGIGGVGDPTRDPRAGYSPLAGGRVRAPSRHDVAKIAMARLADMLSPGGPGPFGGPIDPDRRGSDASAVSATALERRRRNRLPRVARAAAVASLLLLCEPSHRRRLRMLRTRNVQGWCALHFAAKSGVLAWIDWRSMLGRHVSMAPLARTTSSGTTALQLAVWNGHAAAVAALLGAWLPRHIAPTSMEGQLAWRMLAFSEWGAPPDASGVGVGAAVATEVDARGDAPAARRAGFGPLEHRSSFHDAGHNRRTGGTGKAALRTPKLQTPGTGGAVGDMKGPAGRFFARTPAAMGAASPSSRDVSSALASRFSFRLSHGRGGVLKSLRSHGSEASMMGDRTPALTPGDTPAEGRNMRQWLSSQGRLGTADRARAAGDATEEDDDGVDEDLLLELDCNTPWRARIPLNTADTSSAQPRGPGLGRRYTELDLAVARDHVDCARLLLRGGGVCRVTTGAPATELLHRLILQGDGVAAELLLRFHGNGVRVTKAIVDVAMRLKYPDACTRTLSGGAVTQHMYECVTCHERVCLVCRVKCHRDHPYRYLPPEEPRMHQPQALGMVELAACECRSRASALHGACNGLTDVLDPRESEGYKYVPNPIDTSAVDDALNFAPDSALGQAVSVLGRNSHEVWAAEKRRQGWLFGKKRDDERKRHQALLPWDHLPDSDRSYNEESVRVTLKVIRAMGYHLLFDCGARGSDTDGTEAEARLVDVGAMDADEWVALRGSEILRSRAVWQSALPEESAALAKGVQEVDSDDIDDDDVSNDAGSAARAARGGSGDDGDGDGGDDDDGSDAASVGVHVNVPASSRALDASRRRAAKEYVPKALDTSKVVLRKEMLDLVELLAKNTHDEWAAQKLAMGFRYAPHRGKQGAPKAAVVAAAAAAAARAAKSAGSGAPRSEAAPYELRTSPMLVPYSMLTEKEKDYSRRAVAEQIKAMLLLGFRFHAPPGVLDVSALNRKLTDGELADLRIQLANITDFKQGVLDAFLLSAARRGDTNVVNMLFTKSRSQSGPLVNCTDELQRSPLFHAIQHAHTDTARALIGYGADIEQLDAYGVSPLSVAAFVGDVAACSLLLEHGAHYTQRDRIGVTPIHYAAFAGNVGVCRLLARKLAMRGKPGVDFQFEDLIARALEHGRGKGGNRGRPRNGSTGSGGKDGSDGDESQPSGGAARLRSRQSGRYSAAGDEDAKELTLEDDDDDDDDNLMIGSATTDERLGDAIANAARDALARSRRVGSARRITQLIKRARRRRALLSGLSPLSVAVAARQSGAVGVLVQEFDANPLRKDKTGRSPYNRALEDHSTASAMATRLVDARNLPAGAPEATESVSVVIKSATSFRESSITGVQAAMARPQSFHSNAQPGDGSGSAESLMASLADAAAMSAAIDDADLAEIPRSDSRRSERGGGGGTGGSDVEAGKAARAKRGDAQLPTTMQLYGSGSSVGSNLRHDVSLASRPTDDDDDIEQRRALVMEKLQAAAERARDVAMEFAVREERKISAMVELLSSSKPVKTRRSLFALQQFAKQVVTFTVLAGLFALMTPTAPDYDNSGVAALRGSVQDHLQGSFEAAVEGGGAGDTLSASWWQWYGNNLAWGTLDDGPGTLRAAGAAFQPDDVTGAAVLLDHNVVLGSMRVSQAVHGVEQCRASADATGPLVNVPQSCLGEATFWGDARDEGFRGVVSSTNVTQRRLLRALHGDQGAAERWFGPDTATIYLDVNLYNPHLDVFAVIRMAASHPTVGSFEADVSVVAGRLFHGRFQPSRTFQLVVAVVVVVQAFNLWAQTRQKGWNRVLTGWELYEVVTWWLFLLILAIDVVLFEVVTALRLDLLDGDQWMDLQTAMVVLEIETDAIAILMLMLVIRFVKYLRLIPGSGPLAIGILETSLNPTVLMYLAVLLGLQFSFAVGFHIAFGSLVAEFDTVFHSFLALFTISFAGDWDSLTGLPSQVSTVFFFVFYALVAIVLINLFIGIVSDVYPEARSKSKLEWERSITVLMEERLARRRAAKEAAQRSALLADADDEDDELDDDDHRGQGLSAYLGRGARRLQRRVFFCQRWRCCRRSDKGDARGCCRYRAANRSDDAVSALPDTSLRRQPLSKRAVARAASAAHLVGEEELRELARVCRMLNQILQMERQLGTASATAARAVAKDAEELAETRGGGGGVSPSQTLGHGDGGLSSSLVSTPGLFGTPNAAGAGDGSDGGSGLAGGGTGMYGGDAAGNGAQGGDGAAFARAQGAAAANNVELQQRIESQQTMLDSVRAQVTQVNGNLQRLSRLVERSLEVSGAAAGAEPPARRPAALSMSQASAAAIAATALVPRGRRRSSTAKAAAAAGYV